MAAFITNFQSPVEIEDLIDRFKRGRITNIDMILRCKDYQELEWTTDKTALVGEQVFFMCAKTSKDHMGHICVQTKATGDANLIAFAECQRKKYKQYAGKIVAIGRVAAKPFPTADSGWGAAYWRSPWYAKFNHIQVLENPICIDEFRHFITVSRTGAITRLTDAQCEELHDIIAKNNDLWDISDLGAEIKQAE